MEQTIKSSLTQEFKTNSWLCLNVLCSMLICGVTAIVSPYNDIIINLCYNLQLPKFMTSLTQMINMSNSLLNIHQKMSIKSYEIKT
jgi:hypothetical protein